MTGSVVNSGASPIVEQTIKTPENVTVMMKLKKLGWGSARIAKELGISKNTVKRYLRHGGWVGYRRPKRSRQLDGLEEWIREAFHQHQGNAVVVREELKRLVPTALLASTVFSFLPTETTHATLENHGSPPSPDIFTETQNLTNPIIFPYISHRSCLRHYLAIGRLRFRF